MTSSHIMIGPRHKSGIFHSFDPRQRRYASNQWRNKQRKNLYSKLRADARTVGGYISTIKKWVRDNPKATDAALAVATGYASGGAGYVAYGLSTYNQYRKFQARRRYSSYSYTPRRRRNNGRRNPYVRPYKRYKKRCSCKPKYRFKRKPRRFNKYKKNYY